VDYDWPTEAGITQIASLREKKHFYIILQIKKFFIKYKTPRNYNKTSYRKKILSNSILF